MFRNLIFLGCFFLTLSMIGCKKDVNTIQENKNENIATTFSRSVYSSRSVGFGWSNGYYTQTRANSDFGNMLDLSATDLDRLYVSSETLRCKLIKNASSSASGVVSKVDIANGTRYEVKFRVRFHSEFNFVKGGKCGFGLLIGTGNTGGDKPTGTGGSVRIVFRKESNGDITLRPYVYHYDQPGIYGEMFGARYPATGSIVRGQWYDVTIRVFSNSGTSKNGVCYININGNTILYKQDIRYTTNDDYRRINYMSFSSFYGGSGTEWESPTDGLIYYDNVSFSRLAL